MVQTPVKQTLQPNLYELADEYIQITYSTTSFVGEPQLSYKDDQKTLNFKGDDIRSQETEIGTLITVTLKTIPDLQIETLTLLVPIVNLLNQQETVNVETIGIHTLTKTTIAGSATVKGQVQAYSTLHLKGTAKFVFF